MSFPFNVRVYGLLCNSFDEVLVTDELISGYRLTKFPGGGLEFGEGTLECIKRECKEELDLDVNVISHFYTTDFFVESIFNKEQQVISIYYLLEAMPGSTLTTSTYADFEGFIEGEIRSIRWLQIDFELINEVSLPIDKKVCELLLRYYSA